MVEPSWCGSVWHSARLRERVVVIKDPEWQKDRAVIMVRCANGFEKPWDLRDFVKDFKPETWRTPWGCMTIGSWDEDARRELGGVYTNHSTTALNAALRAIFGGRRFWALPLHEPEGHGSEPDCVIGFVPLS